MQTKKCSKCGEVKPVEAFRKWRRQCKVCCLLYNKEYKKEYRKNNRELIASRAKRHREDNIEAERSRAKRYRSASPDARMRDSLVQHFPALDRNVIRNLITPELIEAKRAHLQMVRTLRKEKQKCKINN